MTFPRLPGTSTEGADPGYDITLAVSRRRARKREGQRQDRP